MRIAIICDVLGEENIAVAQLIDTIQAPSQEKVEDLSEQKNTFCKINRIYPAVFSS